MVRAGIYARISSDREGQELGVRRQIADCEKLVKQNGWTVADRYVDNSISAYSGTPRPEYRRLLEDIRDGLIDAVVVWHYDRLHRQPKELEEFSEVIDGAGVTRLATVTGEVDLATNDGRFMARIQGAVARKESDDRSRRIRRKAEESAAAGRVHAGGSRPYGYEDDRITIRPSEGIVVQECVARVLAGEGIRSVCADLNERGVPTVSGKPWRSTTMARMLRSPRISGQRGHHGTIVADGEWEGIITPQQTAQLRALLSDPRRRTNRTARRYLLVRLLRCGLCGETLVSRPTDNGRRRYICARGTNYSGCGRIFIDAHTLELYLVEAVLHRLDSPELVAALEAGGGDPDADRIQAELDDAKAQLDELAGAYGAKSIGLSEWLTARKPIEERITQTRRQLARLSRVAVLDGHVGHAPALRERWADLPLSRQRSIVAAILDHAIIGPGRRGYNRFDPARVSALWRV